MVRKQSLSTNVNTATDKYDRLPDRNNELNCVVRCYKVSDTVYYLEV